MKEFTYVVKDSAGIHARPAGLLAKKAAGFKSDIIIKKGEKEVAAKKLLALMSLCVKCEDQITIAIEGEDEDTAYTEIKAFLEENL